MGQGRLLHDLFYLSPFAGSPRSTSHAWPLEENCAVFVWHTSASCTLHRRRAISSSHVTVWCSSYRPSPGLRSEGRSLHLKLPASKMYEQLWDGMCWHLQSSNPLPKVAVNDVLQRRRRWRSDSRSDGESSKPQLVHEHVEQIVVLRSGVPSEVSTNNLDVCEQFGIIGCSENCLQTRNICLCYNDRKFSPIDYAVKGKVVLIRDDDRNTSVLDGITNSSCVDLQVAITAYDIRVQFINLTNHSEGLCNETKFIDRAQCS